MRSIASITSMCARCLCIMVFSNLYVIQNGAEQNLDETRKSSESVAHSASQGLNNFFKPLEAQPDIGSSIGYKGTDIRGAGSELSNLPLEGDMFRGTVDSKCDKESCNVNFAFSDKAIGERETKLEGTGFARDGNQFIATNSGTLDKAKHQTKTANFDFLTGSYKDCEATQDSRVVSKNKVCEQFFDIKYNNCMANQVIEIDPKYTYVCSKKREEKHKICRDEIVHISCKDHNECDNGGIIPGSVQSDMKWEYVFPTLTIGTIADNYWGGNCTIYDRSTKFEIRNLDKITDFRLVQVGFDDYLWIKINGNTVYVGPDGGDRIELAQSDNFWQRTVVSNGRNHRSCERNTNQNINVNVDLKPHLKEGQNEIWMRVIVSGSGEGWMKISARQHCCKDWIINRETKCEYS